MSETRISLLTTATGTSAYKVLCRTNLDRLLNKTDNSCSCLQQCKVIKKTRHRASISMYSLAFCVRFLLPECHQWKPAVQTAAVMLRTPPSAAGRRRASRARFPYAARVRPRTDRQTDRHTHTDARDHNIFCVVYYSRKM